MFGPSYRILDKLSCNIFVRERRSGIIPNFTSYLPRDTYLLLGKGGSFNGVFCESPSVDGLNLLGYAKSKSNLKCVKSGAFDDSVSGSLATLL
jgi:hypothetical protein